MALNLGQQNYNQGFNPGAPNTPNLNQGLASLNQTRSGGSDLSGLLRNLLGNTGGGGINSNQLLAGGAGLGGLFGSLFGGGNTPRYNESVPLLSGQQQGVQNQALQNALQMLMGGGQNKYEGWEDIAQGARNNFNQQTVPGLAERFTSIANGKTSSGALTSQLSQGGAGLESLLAGQKANYGLQNQNHQLNQLQQLLGVGFQPSFQQVQHEEEPGFGEQIGKGMLQLLPWIARLYGIPI